LVDRPAHPAVPVGPWSAGGVVARRPPRRVVGRADGVGFAAAALDVPDAFVAVGVALARAVPVVEPVRLVVAGLVVVDPAARRRDVVEPGLALAGVLEAATLVPLLGVIEVRGLFLEPFGRPGPRLTGAEPPAAAGDDEVDAEAAGDEADAAVAGVAADDPPDRLARPAVGRVVVRVRLVRPLVDEPPVDAVVDRGRLVRVDAAAAPTDRARARLLDPAVLMGETVTAASRAAEPTPLTLPPTASAVEPAACRSSTPMRAAMAATSAAASAAWARRLSTCLRPLVRCAAASCRNRFVSFDRAVASLRSSLASSRPAALVAGATRDAAPDAPSPARAPVPPTASAVTSGGVPDLPGFRPGPAAAIIALHRSARSHHRASRRARYHPARPEGSGGASPEAGRRWAMRRRRPQRRARRALEGRQRDVNEPPTSG
jgi:hypothetical protein